VALVVTVEELVFADAVRIMFTLASLLLGLEGFPCFCDVNLQ